MSLATGSLAVVDDILSYQQYNRILTSFRDASAPANAQPGSIFSKSSDDRLYHAGAASAQEEVLQLTRSKSASPQFASLRLMDTDASNYLSLVWNDARAANQTLNIVTGAADRTVTLSANFEYSEGTWVPTYLGGGGSAGGLAESGYGVYTKTGRLVTVTGRLTLTNNGDWTGVANIGGLPFDSQGAYFGGTIGCANVTYDGQLSAFVGASSKTFSFLITKTATALAFLDCSAVADAGDFLFSFSYIV